MSESSILTAFSELLRGIIREEIQSAIRTTNERSQQEEKLYSPTEFAERNHVSKATLWRWVKVGILKPTKIGGKVFYKQSDLLEG